MRTTTPAINAPAALDWRDLVGDSDAPTTRIVHVHGREDGLIVDMLCVVRGQHIEPEARVRVGRLRRYPSTHCRTCGESVYEANDVLPEVVAL
ncbi:hypothetical protein [Mycobacterium sp. Aquia_213]|uniref:hypothetical protein n=1 Tax=Mycobacterium sp. Aquia_213 TaxID=2991728 RepID=UPI00226ECBC6|nr:hypothetical protein [Mycobacterium sp. Aquia_213]WAC90999.1 hypothetical protein LMQ14_24460 [Mycobacterium sp. Aquia_213]